MFDILNNGTIEITRGDSFISALYINKGTLIAPKRYELGNDDSVVFSVIRPNGRYSDALISKEYTANSLKTSDGDIVISLTPEETLDMVEGKYYYCVKLFIKNAGLTEVCTIIPEKEFFVLR